MNRLITLLLVLLLASTANAGKAHQNRLNTLAAALAFLRSHLSKTNNWQNTLVVTYSEFGRRLSPTAAQAIALAIGVSLPPATTWPPTIC